MTFYFSYSTLQSYNFLWTKGKKENVILGVTITDGSGVIVLKFTSYRNFNSSPVINHNSALYGTVRKNYQSI